MKSSEKAQHKQRRLTTVELAYIAVSVALITVCSWINVPIGPVPFTLQTFAVFLTGSLLGGSSASLAVIVYMLLGAFGIPVFSGMKGGLAVLFGPTGGYILGFLCITLLLALSERHFGRGLLPTVLTMITGLLLCYGFGTLWFMHVYIGEDGSRPGLLSVLSLCVFPYLLPDALKMALALGIGNNKTLRRLIRESRQGKN
ncbi:MAG: biotin transporter BioY [Lachnospiraceae bacterium]|nr:biotin transporter BioY [Lachnospiraceae bacterium]